MKIIFDDDYFNRKKTGLGEIKINFLSTTNDYLDKAMILYFAIFYLVYSIIIVTFRDYSINLLLRTKDFLNTIVILEIFVKKQDKKSEVQPNFNALGSE